MSVTHNIINKQPLDISRLDKLISTIDGATYVHRGGSVFYFWIDGKSTRGFDITLEEDYIEIRNTVLSNRHDYDLTNKIVSEIIALTDGIIFNEDEEQVSNFPIFNNDRITKAEINDCKVIQVLSRENEDITIYSPIRKVHFGKRLHEQLKELEGEQLRDKIFDIILNVNYQIPNFENGNIMQVGDSDDNKKIMKLLTNDTDYIIGKYDYILLHTSDEQPIMITNDILNTMLPANWILVDEFTVVAPMTEENEWNKLLSNAKKFDLWNDFLNSQ